MGLREKLVTLEAGSLGVWAAWGLGLRGKLESLEAGSLWSAKLRTHIPECTYAPRLSAATPILSGLRKPGLGG